MVFSARCLCTKHTTWSHGDVLPDGLRVADSEELRFCEVDTSKNKGRKRKICLACRGRIAAEIKCMRFEDEQASQYAIATEHVPFVDIGEVEIDNAVSPSSRFASSCSKQVQVLDVPLRPYKEAEKRTQQVMRAKTIEVIEDCANKFVHFNAKDIPEFAYDLVNCKKWKSTFGSCQSKDDNESVFLSNLAAEYKRCKDKDVSKAIREKSAKQKQKVSIGQTLRNSRISLSGSTSDVFKSRVDAAKDLGRIRSYADEKRRLLSIVAMDYSYSTLQKLFDCSSKTITAARVHCILFGRGGVPMDKFKFRRQCVSSEVLEELCEFLHRDDVSRPSSCRSVLVQGEETAVRYWQDTVKGLVSQYLLEFPNGVKRTYIYRAVARIF
ncbi:hypothetical protein OS493_018514 [Desmophyllum pertusum]|uniref:Uncharacterized protein n=1 Tax=Desmophyllum pertusum TaxID=174260 RepID=A0A9X0D8P7_9CNID|nr:hypothetical protein OS493_018514 [Desmophyllum pertusum]